MHDGLTSSPQAYVEPGAADTGTSGPVLRALVDKTLADGFAWLRFPAPLEGRFLADTAASRLRTLLIAGTLVGLVLNLFLISDQAMLPDVFGQAVLWRTWVLTPVCLAGAWMMSRLPFPWLRELLAVSAGVLASLVHVYLASISQSPHSAAYMTGLTMVILYNNVFVRCRFWLAVPSTLAVLLIYLASLWLVQNHSLQLSVSIGLVLFATALFTLYNLYTLEQEERHNYLMTLRQRLLKQELTHANQELERVARYDGLTQAANRRHFDEFLSHLWERAKSTQGHALSIIMIDVDHFKAYNDHYGHPAGDACLVQVADAVQRCLRRPGDLVARYGGEEFIAVLNRAPLEQALAAAERVREAIEALNLPHEAPITHGRVTASIGVATLLPGERQTSAERLIALADEALYQAKNRGRNRVWPDPATHAAPPSAPPLSPEAAAPC
jgi:diguanylate cyclase (GGDEF)-like protein